MRIKNSLFIILATSLISLPACLYGQSSLNTYSPYSFYGLGDMSVQGTANQRSMGGAGVAARDYMSINYLNPASYSAIPGQSTLFSVGTEGQNIYLSDAGTKSSFNTFNLRDIAFQMPLGRGLGFAFSVTPFSSIGYKVQTNDMSNTEITEIGFVSRIYTGSGGLNQFKFGLGWEIIKGRLSLGAEAVYYHGNIEREFDLIFNPILGGGNYISMYGSDTEKINTVLANFGVQATLLRQQDKLLSFGAVYRMGGSMRGKITQYIPHQPGVPSAAYLGLVDYVRNRETVSSVNMPHIMTAGLHYARPKYAMALDYTYSTWGSSNPGYINSNEVTFRNTHTVGGGIEWTPNAMDARNYFRRCTYRAGARYSDYYMVKNGHNISDVAITFGMGFPLDPRRRNHIDVGLEAGTRGTTRYGLIKENYFKFSIGFRLFGDDYWFQKYKYN